MPNEVYTFAHNYSKFKFNGENLCTFLAIIIPGVSQHQFKYSIALCILHKCIYTYLRTRMYIRDYSDDCLMPKSQSRVEFLSFIAYAFYYMSLHWFASAHCVQFVAFKSIMFFCSS